MTVTFHSDPRTHEPFASLAARVLTAACWVGPAAFALAAHGNWAALASIISPPYGAYLATAPLGETAAVSAALIYTVTTVWGAAQIAAATNAPSPAFTAPFLRP